MNATDCLQRALESIRSKIAIADRTLAVAQIGVENTTKELDGLRADEKSIIAALDILQGATQDVEASLAVARGKDG